MLINVEKLGLSLVYIARDKDGGLYLYSNKPEKQETTWDGDLLGNLGEFESLSEDAQIIIFGTDLNDIEWEDDIPYAIINSHGLIIDENEDIYISDKNINQIKKLFEISSSNEQHEKTEKPCEEIKNKKSVSEFEKITSLMFKK